MFTLYFAKQPEKFLKRCDPNLTESILKKIQMLNSDPVPHKARKVVNEEHTFRVRVGDYRVIYKIFWAKNEILVVAIKKRSRAYN